MKKEVVKQFRWLKCNKKMIVICANVVYIIVSVILGSILTVKSVRVASIIRGYTAVGGEWFVLLIVLLISEIIKSFFVYIIRKINEVRKDSNEAAKIIELQSYRKKKRR